MAANPLDFYVYVIVALLPLSAGLLVFQVNPYNALVIRGILGAVAALVYAVLGGADVALTEALVGTLLAITLYAVAVRSSLVMRLGVLADERAKARQDGPWAELMDSLRTLLRQRHMRLEVIPYDDAQALHQALVAKDIHGTCRLQPSGSREATPEKIAGTKGINEIDQTDLLTCLITVRVPRLYELMQADLKTDAAQLVYASATSIAPAEPSLRSLKEEQL